MTFHTTSPPLSCFYHNFFIFVKKMNSIDNISKYVVFGLSFESESSLILLSIPFELTTTFREGTLYAPLKIKRCFISNRFNE